MSIKGFSMSNLKAKSKEIVKLAIDIGQDNYPEVMGKMFIVNSPFLFTGAWAVISPFIDAKTRKKISIVGAKYQKELLTHIDPENLPVEYGGECTCPEFEKGCLYSNKGPWNEYPGDEFGEAAKKAIFEEEKSQMDEYETSAVTADESKASEDIKASEVSPVAIPEPVPAVPKGN